MEKITVSLGKRSYPIIIASGLSNNLDSFFPLKSGDKVMLITDKRVFALHFNKINQLLVKIGVNVDSIILPEGEQNKNLKTINSIFNALLNKFHGRDTTLIALGGGVIGDLTGFAAASYKRGVRFIQISTTLLSQIDSSIGGKTSINHPLGKNMIGTFWQPILVVLDPNFLKTLPFRELISGIAEAIKYAIALDGAFFNWLEENIDSLLCLDHHTLMYCIRKCCKLKSKIVSIDERENNLRTLLNLGHTYGHAIENEMGYGNWLHGEAISAGIVMAARTSERLGQFKEKETERIINLLKRVGLPIKGPHEMSEEAYFSHMKRDKKAISGKIRLVLPLRIGRSEVQNIVSQKIISDVISDCKKL